jgi:hypothetical protein
MQSSLRGGTPKKTAFYAIVGIVLSVSAAALYSAMHRRSERIEQLSAALGSDLRALIGRGESANLEFKSSFRWDLRENKLNRALEAVVLKTLAGYMNGNGGTLLIGVADDGSVTGLEHDYTTLKKPDRDGFEQVLMTAIATKLGGDACQRRADGIPFAGEQGCLPDPGCSGASANLREGRRQSEALRTDGCEYA